MGSLYLSSLTPEQKEDLRKRLWEIQNGRCFICEHSIDLQLHKGALEIDHIEPISGGGKDDPSNFGLTHGSCNASKLASDLRVARILARFRDIREECAQEQRGPNLNDVLQRYGGARYPLRIKIEGAVARYSFPEIGDNDVYTSPVFVDELSAMKYFFAKLPIAYLFHDDRINPRSIGMNIAGLVEEFFRKRPQLHVSLGWTSVSSENENGKIRVFDGQHKAAAQILLGVKRLPVRVFLNPDLDILLTTNTNAGTTLRQIAFDKSVQRHLGSALYIDRIERYQKDRNLAADNLAFSERDLVKHFKGESREMKRYILDAVRDNITHNPDNKLKDYIDFGGRSKEKPLSYSTIEKTFYSFFIYQELLETPIGFRIEEGENPRQLEKEQIVKLMNIIAKSVYIGKYDPGIGTHRIENRIQKGEKIAEDHLIAYRMSREEIMYTWLKYVQQIAKNYFIILGKPVNEDRLFQYKFPEGLWEKIGTFVLNLRQLPLWINTELSLSVFGGKQSYEYWQTIFETGRSPQGQQVLAAPLNLMEMIKT